MSNLIIKFYRKDPKGNDVLVRTEEVSNEFEADFTLEQEEGHYDYAVIEDNRKS